MTARLRTLVAASLAAALLAPAAASADYLNFGSWSGYGHSNNNNNNYYRNNYYQNGYHNNWQGYGNGYYNQNRDCRPVKQKLRDQFGNRVVIQSIQCYDRHGYAYIVPGSSQVLGWH